MSIIGKTFGFMGKTLLVLFVIGVIGSLIDAEDTPATATTPAVKKPKVTNYGKCIQSGLCNRYNPNASKKTEYASRIVAYAYVPYTIDQFPKTVAQFRSRLPEIERHKKMAMHMALDTGHCDFVEQVELSTRSTLKKLIYWVDCSNGQRQWSDFHRFWFYEDDFKD